MRLSLTSLLLATGALALAGCIGGAPPPEQAPQPTGAGDVETPALAPVAPLAPAGPEPYIQTWPFEGHITAGAGQPGVGYFAPLGSQDPHAWGFDVGERATTIVAELAWQDPATDLDLELATPTCDITTGTGDCLYAQDGAAAAGDTPLRFVVTDPGMVNQTGHWGVYIWAKNAVNAQFKGAVTVFYDMVPADDYTALQ